METLRRWTRRIFIGLALAALLVTCGGLVARHVGSRRYEAEIARIRASGAPVTADELAPPEIPRAENAARLYRAAGALLLMPSWGEDLLTAQRVDAAIEGRVTASAVPASLEAETVGRDVAIAELRALLARNAHPLALLHEAARLPRARFDVRYEDGPATEMAHLTELRTLVRLALAEGRLALLEGRPQDAHGAVLAALGAAHATAAEPMLVSRLVTIANQRSALALLEEALEEAPPSVSTASALLEVLTRFERTTLARATAGDRVSFLIGLEDSSPWNLIGEIAPLGASRDILMGELRRLVGRGGMALHGCFLARLDTAHGLARYQEIIERLERPFPAALELPPDAPYPAYAPLSEMLIPVLGGLAREEGRARARVALARLAIARAGGGPAGATALPVDPFTGAPMLSRAEGDRALVYSVGPNRRDDGGRNDQAQDGEADDIAFRTRP